MTCGFSCCRTLEGWPIHTYILLSEGIWRQVWCSALAIIIPLQFALWQYLVCSKMSLGLVNKGMRGVWRMFCNKCSILCSDWAGKLQQMWLHVEMPWLHLLGSWLSNVLRVKPAACHSWLTSNNFQNFTDCYIGFFFCFPPPPSNSTFKRMQRVDGKHRSVPKEPAPSIHPAPCPPPRHRARCLQVWNANRAKTWCTVASTGLANSDCGMYFAISLTWSFALLSWNYVLIGSLSWD